MQLTFENDNLLSALQLLQGVASGRNTLPVLSNVLIEASDGNIECVATDLEVGIKIKVKGDIQEEGAITISAKKLGDMVKELPKDEPIRFSTTANDRVQISCGEGTYKIVGLPSDEFPQLPSVDSDSIAVDGKMLRDVIRKTEICCCD